jgi:hypothetical protein
MQINEQLKNSVKIQNSIKIHIGRVKKIKRIIMKKNNIFKIIVLLFSLLLMYMSYNYYKHYKQQRVLKIINVTDRKVDYLLCENVYNFELFEMSKPFFNSRYYAKGKLVDNVVKRDFMYYSKSQLKEFAIPNNDWENFLQKNKKYKLFVLDVDSLRVLNSNAVDSNAVKKVILKEVALSIDYLDNNNWIINFND